MVGNYPLKEQDVQRERSFILHVCNHLLPTNMFTVSGQPQKSEFDGVPKPVQIQIRKPESRRKGFQSPSPPLLLGQGHILHFAFLNGTVKSLPTLNGSMAFSMSNLSSRFAKTNFAPAFTLANWFYAYCNLSPRFFKMAVGIDHNLSPREDLSKYGEVAVREGKLSRRRLDQIRRMQSAHENSVEGFTLFVASGEFLTSTYKFKDKR